MAQTADWQWTITNNNSDGSTEVDIALASNGEIALISGATRAIQMVEWWIRLQQRSYLFDVEYGNSVRSILGATLLSERQYADDLMTQAEAYFLQTQNVEAALGYISPDEAIASITAVDAVSPIPGTLLINYQAITQTASQLNNSTVIGVIP